MIRILKRILKLIAILLLTANFFLAALNAVRAENSIGQKPPLTSAELKQRADKGLTFLRSKQAGDGSLDNAGTSGWAAIAFGAAETYAENVKNGSTSLLDFLKSYKPQKATDFARQILAALASGKDPRNFGGYDLITELKRF